MRPRDIVLLVAIPSVAMPLHGGHLHLVVDTVLGAAVGVALVALYLLALRWIERSRGHAPREDDRESRSIGQRSRNR